MDKKTEIRAKVPKTAANDYYCKARKTFKTQIVAISPEFMPIYAHSDDTCCDLKANIPEGEVAIGFGEVRKIDTGIKIQLPVGFEAQIRCRSGLACKGLMMVNGIGTIDTGYRGSIMAIVTNASRQPITIKHLDKIAQMALKPVYYFDFEQVDTLDNTERGEKGFGSTGA